MMQRASSIQFASEGIPSNLIGYPQTQCYGIRKFLWRCSRWLLIVNGVFTASKYFARIMIESTSHASLQNFCIVEYPNVSIVDGKILSVFTSRLDSSTFKQFVIYLIALSSIESH